MKKAIEMTTEEILNCPIYKTMEIFQGKWNAWVLFELGRNETLRFGELKKAIPGISNTVLTTTLRDLEERGLISRIRDTAPCGIRRHRQRKGLEGHLPGNVGVG